MTREQLRLRYIGTVGRHWRSSLDQSGPTPGMIDDLVDIAEEHAADLRKAETRKPPVVAANTKVTGGGGGGEFEASLVVTPNSAESGIVPSSAHRTRTRTRGGKP